MKRFTLTRTLTALALALLMVLPFGLTAFADEIAGSVIEYTGEEIDLLTAEYYTAQAKLATMKKVYEEFGYELYVQIQSGEVAVLDTLTGQTLFTNPYDLGSTGASTTQKEELLSQIILSYKDQTGTYTMNSYKDCVEYDQIEVSRIRGGVRVQYTIGETTKRKLAPRQISKTRFEEMILNPITLALGEDSNDVFRLTKFYMLKDPSDPELTPKAIDEMTTTYPYCETEPIYVLTGDVTDKELNDIQGLIQEHTEYTMDDMQADHNLTGYVMTDDSPPVFQMSLEYLLEKGGFSVRLPARGITFDSSLYKLLSVSVLPYFGAGRSVDEGYCFIPDGAGAIIDFADIAATTTVSGDLYGTDFSFHSASGGTMATWRMPVYGVVSNRPDNVREGALDPVYNRQGYVAFMTEGDALTRLTSYHGGSLHNYNSVYPTYYPRQVDSYPLAGITVSGGVATYEIDAPRTYVGNFTTKYRFLWEDDANYVGMAKKWREYLTEAGVLNRLTADDGADIPLYLTTFGDLDTKAYILGVPVDTKTSLTTFEEAQSIISLLKGKVLTEADAQTVAKIFDEEFEDTEVTIEAAQKCLDNYLAGRDVKNLNLQYVGWYNGGMTSTPPSKMKPDKVLGGTKGAQELSAFAAENGVQIFYDLEYTFVGKTSAFDAFSFDRDAAKTVEGAMSREKTYDPVGMAFKQTQREIISATALSRFYNRIDAKYTALNSGTISLESLGGFVNTDHTEERPINREESKNLVIEFLGERVEAGQETMLGGGNAYTWAYADNILSVPLDSSSRLTTSREVPFIGIVLHGHVDFAGEAINLAGDYHYSVLKAIENGASPSFKLSFDNTSELKSSGYSHFYSVQFDIWYDDLIETYDTLNGALKGVRNSLIVGHDEVADRIIEVTYDNGTKFLLNYNNIEVTYGDYTIEALGFVVE